ncbi:MAG: protein kinase [Mycobacteriaceae bacterium]|nr:protein kinase [Mycobacteriaceae bacterium]
MPHNEVLREGSVFAGYTIVRPLGSGGMGDVYLVQHPRLPRNYALKVLSAELSVNDEYRHRFSREADLAAGLSHPNIVGIHDRGEFHGQLWISMDYVAGGDAAHLLYTRSPAGLPASDVVEIATAVADALDYAHSRGLLHRDIKPANILLGESSTSGRRIALADFGIARYYGDISGLTATNMVVGTTAYCAPEQLQGASSDGRADQYALACTVYHLLTGVAPFHDPNPAVVIARHLSAPPPLIGDRRPDLANLDTALVKALAKNPDERYPNCGEFAAALNNAFATTQAAAHATTHTIARSSPPAATLPQTSWRQRVLRPVPLIVTAIAVIAVAVLVGARLPALFGSRTTGPSGDLVAPSSAVAADAGPTRSGPQTIELARYITDQSGALGPIERVSVELALNNLYANNNIRLWVVYVRNFAGLTPSQWTENTMHANRIPDTEALLAIATSDGLFSLHVPKTLPAGTGTDIEQNRIRPALQESDWARAAVFAANGLEAAAPNPSAATQ